MSFRMLKGTTKTSKVVGAGTVGKEVAATGCSNTAGSFALKSSSDENVMAMTMYSCMCNSLEAICWVDTSAAVTGWLKPAMVDTACDGVAATDAGANCDFEIGKPRGDADPVVAELKVLATIFALGGAGLTMTRRSTENMTERPSWWTGWKQTTNVRYWAPLARDKYLDKAGSAVWIETF